MRNVLCAVAVTLFISGCKTTLEQQRGDFIDRCVETHLLRGDAYRDIISVCELSADRFIGSAHDRK